MRALDITASEYGGCCKVCGFTSPGAHYLNCPLVERAEKGEKYKTDWMCDNCFKQFTHFVARGHKRPPLIECPNCGCLTHGRGYG